jgi:hypothetical protein
MKNLQTYLTNRLAQLDVDRAALDAALAEPLTMPVGTIEKLREVDAAARELRAVVARLRESERNAANP